MPLTRKLCMRELHASAGLLLLLLLAFLLLFAMLRRPIKEPDSEGEEVDDLASSDSGNGADADEKCRF